MQRGGTEIWQQLLLEIFLTSAQRDQFVLLVSIPVQGFTLTAPAQDLPLDSLKEWGSVSVLERLQEYLFFRLHSPFLYDTYADFYSCHATQTVDIQEKSVSKV